MDVTINGHPTWVDDRGGDGPPVLLLHGAFGSSGELTDGLGVALEDAYRVVAFDRRGHGRTADTDAPFHYADMAAETVSILEAVVGGPAHLVGYSDGGIVSLLVALERPDLVESMVLMGVNYHYDGFHPLDLDPDSPMVTAIAEGYAAISPDGAEHFPTIVEKTIAMITSEPTLTVDDLAGVAPPTLVLVGDDDAVKLAHTCALYEALPQGQLAVVPAASHLVPFERPEILHRLVRDFLDSSGSAETLMPIRRAVVSSS